MTRRYITILPALLLSVVFSRSLRAEEPAFIELVESVPVETTLDLENIRNTDVVWLDMIASATQTLNIGIFYLTSEPGEPLEAVLDGIRAAAERGVQVRLLIDSLLRKTYPEPLASLGLLKNINYREINFQEIGGGVMHAKYIIVDGKDVFLGSQNFDWRSIKHIQELGIRIKNEALAAQMTRLFERDWRAASFGRMGYTEETVVLPTTISLDMGDRVVPVTPVFSPKGYLPNANGWDEPVLRRLIDGAVSEVNVQVLTYSTKGRFKELDDALQRAAKRGVKVRLLCSDWCKKPPKIDDLKILSLFPNIEVKMCTIPEYSAGFIPHARVSHCKYMTVDGKIVWIGSNNWEKDYFYKSRNAGVVVEDGLIAREAQSFFDNMWNSEYSYPVDVDTEYAPPKVGEEY
ncbi:MAG TPA: phospholipase D-like domain-containing protein [Elusimicrobiota bacterium]|nr:phospholipase D-like domain-containing protein [Elusimicrobiota bacterium]